MSGDTKLSLLRSIPRSWACLLRLLTISSNASWTFFRVKTTPPHSPPRIPIAVRDDFLSPAEQNFYLVLKAAVADSTIICPKVALGDLFYAKITDPSQNRSYTNKIDRKNVDFLLRDPQTLRPRAGLELDDASHQLGDRQARDAFVERGFAAAHVPLIRIPVRRSYSVSEVRALISQHLATPDVTPLRSEASAARHSALPSCPKCGAEMVLRTPRHQELRIGILLGVYPFPALPRYCAVHWAEPARVEHAWRSHDSRRARQCAHACPFPRTPLREVCHSKLSGRDIESTVDDFLNENRIFEEVQAQAIEESWRGVTIRP